ncbi:hypothetical protein [Rhizobium leguminosarum]|uniref:HEPN domain-containing protein n=1 Tax=Rhizobium leguminosarum TaxID=384 RepID=A0A7W9ZRV2_RHILE|nr:hypothetical protein [Rhizobium leguminosarum]MBB5665593.1 HEPN domain-containing protein [Rhizobium leguminosarum]MBB6221661.1 HEPN domain-containing protein [Rhizobium leguminosarum]
MSNEYPGSNANPWEVLELANAYSLASKLLFSEGKKALSIAPARMCAIHAIELYLNAFLRHEGVAPEEIRGRMHSLVEPMFVAKLKLRKKTALHLKAMTAKREYLISRYAPERTREHTELNRLTATLAEVMEKVGEYLHSAGSGGHRQSLLPITTERSSRFDWGAGDGTKEGAPKRPDILQDKLLAAEHSYR